MTYEVRVAGTAARDLSSTRVPVKVADACVALIYGDLQRHPKRVGKPLDPPFDGVWSARVRREWRLFYEIDDRRRLVEVVAVRHRGKAYQG